MRYGHRNLIEELQKVGETNCLKIVTVSLFIDSNGDIIGRTELGIKKIFPKSIMNKIEGAENEIADILGGM